MKSLSSRFTILVLLLCSASYLQAKYMVVDAVIEKQADSYVVLHKGSDEAQSFQDFGKYLEQLRNGSVIGLKLTSKESIPTDQLLTILNSTAKNHLIDVLDIQFSFIGEKEINRKIEVELKQLNSWNNEELDLFERPQVYPNRKPSGETNSWVTSTKLNLKILGAKVNWNATNKQYELAK